MTNGQLIMKDQASYSPWFRRGQFDAATIGFNVIDRTSNANVTVSVYHRNSEDTNNGTILGSASSLSATGVTIAKREDMKEYFRLKFEGGGESASDWTLVDVYAPVHYSKKR